MQTSIKQLKLETLDINIKAIVSRAVVTCIDFDGKLLTVADEDEMIALHYVKFHDASGNTISLSELLGEFSIEIQRRGELLKTTTIVYPLNRKLFWRQANIEITFEKIGIPDSLQKLIKVQKIVPVDGSGMDDHG